MVSWIKWVDLDHQNRINLRHFVDQLRTSGCFVRRASPSWILPSSLTLNIHHSNLEFKDMPSTLFHLASSHKIIPLSLQTSSTTNDHSNLIQI